MVASKSTALSVWLKGAAVPLKLQVMEGVGTPVEVQEMSTESPSRTVTVGPLMAVVLALTADQRVHTRNVFLYNL